MLVWITTLTKNDMKNRFAEYYELPEERIKEIWEDSLIVFDTNVLLNLYRYNDDARDEFIKVIKFYKERLWIPYQVGFEFHRRRDEIMRKNAKAYSVLAEKLSKELIGVVSSLEGEYARHPYISIKEIKKKVERCAESITKSLEKQEKAHPDYSQDDEILNSVTDLFDGRVGEDFAERDLEALYKEGEKRYANQVPPGYCDEKKKKDKDKRSLYGDLIVWKQTIHHCNEQTKSVIFITDDHKSDWWDKVDGKHSPRKELLKEFADSTGQGVLIYDSSRFLEYAKRNKELKISQKTINEVEKVKTADTFFVTDEMVRALLAFKEMPSEYIGILNKYSKMLEEAKESYHSPMSLFTLGRYDTLEDWSKMIERIGGLSEAQRRMDEIGTLASAWGRKEIKEKLAQPVSLSKNNTEE